MIDLKRKAGKMSESETTKKQLRSMINERAKIAQTEREERAKSAGRVMRDDPLPVTLLSGFLGSGKTTLLKRILNDITHGLRIAVIVNDMSTLNIDATNIEQHTVTESREKMVKMQNGCICCTLRGDLLEELVKLARDGKIDYVLIESTGISEPEQVAETFSEELVRAMQGGRRGGSGMQVDDDGEELEMSEETLRVLTEVEEMGGLNKLAKLDCCVTVVDAFNLFANLNTGDFLSQRWIEEEISEEDERTVSDLLVDQIEFANVILVNKVDRVSQEQKAKVLDLVAKLNPSAKVIECVRCDVDVGEVVSTGLYDFEKAKMGSGWLKDLHELTLRKVNGKVTMAPNPETEEYGISSFVYQARRPFHPKRLFTLIHDKFIVLQQEEQYEDDSEGCEEEAMNDDDSSWEDLGRTGNSDPVSPSEISDIFDDTKSHGSNATNLTDDCSDHCHNSKEEDVVDHLADNDYNVDISENEILENKHNHPLFSKLYRSKGFWWHSNRPSQQGEWSQAGGILTVSGGGPWYCATNEEEWPQDDTVRAMITADFEGMWGDRRQEIVFIGEKLDRAGLTRVFDECLLSDKEMRKWEKVMVAGRNVDPGVLEQRLNRVFEDGWEDWPTSPLVTEEEEE